MSAQEPVSAREPAASAVDCFRCVITVESPAHSPPSPLAHSPPSPSAHSPPSSPPAHSPPSSPLLHQNGEPVEKNGLAGGGRMHANGAILAGIGKADAVSVAGVGSGAAAAGAGETKTAATAHPRHQPQQVGHQYSAGHSLCVQYTGLHSSSIFYSSFSLFFLLFPPFFLLLFFLFFLLRSHPLLFCFFLMLPLNLVLSVADLGVILIIIVSISANDLFNCFTKFTPKNPYRNTVNKFSLF